MPTKIKEVRPPHGLMRLMMSSPIWLFRMHLGWLLGDRFMLLTHTGRKSGQPRQTILKCFSTIQPVTPTTFYPAGVNRLIGFAM